MNNLEEMIVLTWYKGAKNSPWVLTLEDEDNRLREVTVGDKGFASTGPRLSDNLEVMNEQIYRYPMQYDMRQLGNKNARLFSVTILNNKITYVEAPIAFGKELEKSYRQTPFQPLEETVDYIEEGKYFQSARAENQQASISTFSARSARTTKEPVETNVRLLNEYAPNTNIFWFFVHPQNIQVIDSTTVDIYIDAYNWPEGYEVPEMIGSQNILDSQRTVRFDLLGGESFSLNASENQEAAKRYGLFTSEEGEEMSYHGEPLSGAEKEAQEYLSELFKTQNMFAFSLQYSTTDNTPVENNDNLLGIIYGTQFNNLTEVKNSIVNQNFHGVNINKSLIKEFYSKNDQVKQQFKHAQDIPLVEYLNQSAGFKDHGLNVSGWIEDSGIQAPPGDPKDFNTTTPETTDEESIQEMIEETVKDDIENGRNREEHYIHGYINNDLAFIPPSDDRMENGSIYSQVYTAGGDDEVGQLPYDYTHKVRIGDVMLEIPPLSIQSTKEQANESVSTLRNRNAMHKGVGSSRHVLTMDLYFHDLENINGHRTYAYTKDNGRQVFYYMDGLRTLLAQFIKSPFVPIDNDYVNDSLGVNNVVMRNIQAQTVEGFPEALMVTLVLEEFDTGPYLMGQTNLGDVMNYPLYRWYYQQSLEEPTTSFRPKTYLPAVEHLDNTFTFQIANENYLSERTDVIREFNALQTPGELKRKLEAEAEEDNGNKKGVEDLDDQKAAKNALDSYNRYQTYYQSLSSDEKETYKPSTLPIFTTPGQENMKDGSMQEIPQEEYDAGLETGRYVYGDAFNAESITSLLYESVQGDFARTKRRIGIEDSVLIGAYQLDDISIINQLVKNANLPGLFQVTVKNKSHQNNLNDLLDEAKEAGEDDGLTELADPYRRNFFNKDVFFIPAGEVGGVDFLSEITLLAEASEYGEIDNEVESYTVEYNQMVEIINKGEDEIPMDEFYIEDMIPLTLNVQLANNLSEVQAQAAKTPSFQYMGAQQPEVQISFSTTDEGVKQIDDLFRTIARYAKEYRTGLVSNFLTIQNPLVNLFGIQAVLPNTFDISTVEGHPDQKIVTMILSGFDRSQRKQEALYSFAGGKVSTEMKDLHLDGHDPQVNSLYVHEKMKHMELYPDLELPTFNELEEDLKHLNSGVNKLENRTGQIYLDPDFYISTKTTVRKQLNDILGDSRGTQVNFKDDLGVEASANAAQGQGLIVDNETQEEVNEAAGNYVDPYLEWKGYEGSGAESAEEADDETMKIEKDMNLVSTPGSVITPNEDHVSFLKDAGESDKENPSSKEVWKYLHDQVLEVFGDLPEFKEEDLSDLTSVEDGDGDTRLTSAGQSPLIQATYFNHLMNASGSKFLENGIHEQLMDAENAPEAEVETTIIPGNPTFDGFSNINFGYHKDSEGNNNIIPGLQHVRLFMYMKSIIDLESNWRQFEEDGSPLINATDSNGNPYKVGIMGAPLAKASSKSVVEDLANDWKYNIQFSLSNMRTVYDQAKNSPYGDFHGRPLDWAIVGHSGVELPTALTNGTDEPYTDQNLPVTPESIYYFASFSDYYKSATASLKNGSPLAFFSTPEGVHADYMAEFMGITEEEANEYIEEAFELESNNFDQYSLEDKIKHMYVDMQQHDQTGRMVRAFPSFSLMLIDEGKWFQNFRTWDNFYGYNSLHEIDVYKSRKIAADTAVITMSNMYGNLSSSHGTQSNPELRLPSFFSSQFWKYYVFGLPTDRELEARTEQYDQIMLQTGARVHLRMGYGSDASYLPVMFNGSIAEMTTDEVIEIVAQGDALELQNVISGDPEDDNSGFMNRVQEPRRTIGELMTSKGNWLREMVNEVTTATFFKDSPMGIVHFGSTVHSEEGNRTILPGANAEEFGESLQNVYSQNGMEQKSQWHASDGGEIGRVEMLTQEVRSIVTNFSTLLGQTSAFDEDNIAVSYYGRTVWEVIQTFALSSQDYIAEAVPFEFRSTLFFGKPHWMMQYRYDSDFIYDSDRQQIDRTVRRAHVKTFMQAHVYNSYYNIVANNIMASENGVYNNVIVTYDGRQAGPIQADSDIRFDKQRTIDVEANILAPRLTEFFRAEDQANIYGQSTLRDYMKDMYKGEYSIIGDPTVKPYDVVYMNDNINDMHGIHLVKAVHHSMSSEHGLVSHIEPDAYVYNFDEEMGEIASGLFNISKNVNMKAIAGGTLGGVTTLLGSSVLSKLLNKGAEYGASALNSKISLGLMQRTAARFFETVGGLYSKGGATTNAAKHIRSAKTLTEVGQGVKASQAALRADMAVSTTKGAAESASFFTKASDAFANIHTSEGMTKTLSRVGGAAKKSGQAIKGIVTSKTFLFAAGTVVFSVLTSGISEWWSRKKQNAEAIKVIPLIHKGKRWTALMNWHKGAVLGDDPSLRDKLMNAEFFDEDIDPEVNEVLGNSLFKLLNLFFD